MLCRDDVLLLVLEQQSTGKEIRHAIQSFWKSGLRGAWNAHFELAFKASRGPCLCRDYEKQDTR